MPSTFAKLAAVLGAIVAAAATWEGVANYGPIWLLAKRRAAELLKVEGWLFFASAEKYVVVSSTVAFPAFAAEVEHQIAKDSPSPNRESDVVGCRL